uniref:NADH dehydrogenase [ubiquinone] 1 alpha subcomplex subunit 8 n=1 Tax=Corethrella appendiculata TaxID=1370023 RepID=U5ETN5_9DIPT
MVITNDIFLPKEEDLTVEECPLSTPALRAGAFHLGKYCEAANNEFMLCRNETKDPRQCVEAGKAVTACSMEFFRKLKKTCRDEFAQYTHCLDQSSGDLQFRFCRKTQAVYDKCVLENLQIERPEYGYFCRAKVHDTDRPKPPVKEKAVYPDATPGLPEDYPKPPAKYGSRFLWMN